MEKTNKVLNQDQMNHVGSIATTSGKIRYLNNEGFTRYQISKVLNIRYQWVRNVLVTPVKTPKV